METKHTPGPWHVGVRQAHRIIYDQTGWAVADATVYHGKESHGEMLANARLIAAAPRMADAIRFVLSDLNSELDHEARLILESALNEATGA